MYPAKRSRFTAASIPSKTFRGTPTGVLFSVPTVTWPVVHSLSRYAWAAEVCLIRSLPRRDPRTGGGTFASVEAT